MGSGFVLPAVTLSSIRGMSVLEWMLNELDSEAGTLVAHQIPENVRGESKKCDSPFKVRGTCLPENKWRLRVLCGGHNHEAENTSVPLFNRDEEQLGVKLTASGVRPQQVLEALKEKNKESLASTSGSAIYNTRSKLKLKEVARKSVAQEDAGSVNHPHKDSNVMEENTPASNERINVARCFQTDAGPVSHLQKESILMEEDTLISKVGIDVTQ
ncbi:uncharacterized protein LOC113326247 [Papaver somniferum]|uniref:uncharacterized protein LOC113326247 n=1 Tax=Papaver somniferum TaxID=3469 RepID=UPI000E702A8B|nr:uncharacterized protein LOC113326247 [Papaver somniferum]